MPIRVFNPRPQPGFFVHCSSCTRLLIFGQTCVCGVNSMTPNPQPGQAQYVPQWGSVVYYSAPRLACGMCQFEYPQGQPERHDCKGN